MSGEVVTTLYGATIEDVPSYRFGPTVWAVYKDNMDDLYYFGWHSIREDYSGAGTYGQAYLSPIRDETYIDCGAIN